MGCNGRTVQESEQKTIYIKPAQDAESKNSPSQTDLIIPDKGQFISIESGFTSWEGDICIISLDAAGNLSTNIKSSSGLNCPYKSGKKEISTDKLHNLIKLLTKAPLQEGTDNKEQSHSRSMKYINKVKTSKGTFSYDSTKTSPIGAQIDQYLFDLYK